MAVGQAPRDHVAAAKDVFGILRIGRRGRGTGVDIDAGDVVSVVDQVLCDAIDAPVLGVDAEKGLGVEKQLVVRRRAPGDRTVDRVRFLLPVDIVVLGVFAGIAEAVGKFLREGTTGIDRPLVRRVGTDRVADRAFGCIEVGTLADEIDEAADIHRGTLHRGGRAFHDLDGLDPVEVNRKAVAGDAGAHAVDEQVGRLAADARIGRRAEIRRRKRARGELRENRAHR